LGLNESGPNLHLHTEVDAEFTVLGYRYGERDGVTGLEISIQNTGTTAAILSSARVFFMDGDDITLYHGSFTRFPTGGLVAPGAVGGFFKAANDLGNASADKLMILLNFKDPALN
jgi:archaellum component FlaG (FlaF/FlaG flagellin family)